MLRRKNHLSAQILRRFVGFYSLKKNGIIVLYPILPVE